MPDMDDPNLDPKKNQDIPVPSNYPTHSTAPKARVPAITGGVKTSAGSLSKMADDWAKAHPIRFRDPLMVLPTATPTIVVGDNKRVSVAVSGIRYARPTMIYKSTPAVVWKQEGGIDVMTWVLALNDPSGAYTIDDADALAELIQRGLITDYRVGTVIIRNESWYDNSTELPDYKTVPVINWPLEVSTREGRITDLGKKLKVAQDSAADGWKAARNGVSRHSETEDQIHQKWGAVLRDTHAIYLVIIVVIIICCLLLTTCHPQMAGS